MKCAQLQAQLSDYLEGDLPVPVRVRVAAHLADCADCGRELSELRGTLALIRGLPGLEPSAALVPEVMRRIRAGEARPSVWQGLRDALVQLATPRFATPLAGLAALLLYVAVNGGLGLPHENPRPSEPVPSGTPAARPSPASDVRALAMRSPAPRPAAVPDSALTVASASSGFPPAPAAAVVPAELAAVSDGRERARRLSPLARPIPGALDRRTMTRSPGAAAAPVDKAERGRQQLDRRLDLLLERPGVFAQLMAADSVAAQELWLVELGERAVERAIDARVIEALRNSVDPRARSMAEALASAVTRAQQRSTSAGSNR